MTRTAAVVLLLIAAVTVSSFPRAAAAPPEAGGGLKGKLVVVVVDRVGIAEFPGNETPFCRSLADRWATGLMTTRTQAPSRTAALETGAEYVTLGAGMRAYGATGAGLSFDSTERFTGFGGSELAGEVFHDYSGTPGPEAGVVCMRWPEIRRAMESGSLEENAGLLGGELERAGLRTAVVGNCDGYDGPLRLSPLICCDASGTVPLGRVSGFMDPRDTGQPFRLDALAEQSERYLAEADMVVVDTGVTGRLDRDGAASNPYFSAGRTRVALHEVDGLVERLTGRLDLEASLLLVVSPSAPSEARRKGDYWTPFIAAGKGFSRGLLRSASTRRPGLVSNGDFLPTVCEFFGISIPAEVTGSPMRTVPATFQVDHLQDLDAQYAVTRQVRWYVVFPYFFLSLLLLILWVFSLAPVAEFLGWPYDAAMLSRVLRPTALVLAAAPVSFLLASVFRFESVLLPLGFCFAFSLAVGLGAWKLPGWRPGADPFASICWLTAGIIVVDTALGGRLFMLPLLGDNAMEGSRFFGLSNTVAGLLVAVCVWGAAGLGRDRLARPGGARWVLLAGVGALTFVIGFGLLGANAGGVIVAVTTGLVFYFGSAGRRFTAWLDAGIAVAVAAVTVVMVAADALFVRTHAARAATGGAGRIAALMKQRLAIQLGQTTSTLPFAIVLIAAVLLLAVWMRGPGPFWRGLWERERTRTAAFYAILVGGLVAMLFEDTGTGMLAIMMLVSTLALVYYYVPVDQPLDEPTPGG
ncbi:MAG: hypothetical protein V1748_11150 [Actinomycetota bacterium]